MKNKHIYITIISAILLGLAQHCSSLGFVVWFCLIPFIYILHDATSYKGIVKITFIWGVIYNLVTMFWLSSNVGTDRFSAIISMIATILYLSTNTILFGIIWYRLKTYFNKYSIILFVLTWTSIEFIKSYGLLPFPWISIANTQTNYLYLIQMVEYTGIYGITFWILSINGYLYFLLNNNRTNKKLLIGVSIFCFPFLLGYLTLFNYKESNDNYQISLIQPNIKLSDSRDFSKRYLLLDPLLQKTKECINNGSKLVIWPEAALPFHSLQNRSTLEYINSKLLNNSDISILSGDITFEEIILNLLIKNNLTLSLAESCTGGFISKSITDIPGASKFFVGSLIAYSNSIKNNFLNIPSDIIEKHGAVSSEVSELMAINICKKFKSNIALSCTGISGPDGGSKEKPVGTVYISIKFLDKLLTKKFIFTLNRKHHRTMTKQTALYMLWKLLINLKY